MVSVKSIDKIEGSNCIERKIIFIDVTSTVLKWSVESSIHNRFLGMMRHLLKAL